MRWCALAESMGVRGHVAASEAELHRALDTVATGDGPALIEAVVDPRRYGDMLREIRG